MILGRVIVPISAYTGSNKTLLMAQTYTVTSLAGPFAQPQSTAQPKYCLAKISRRTDCGFRTLMILGYLCTLQGCKQFHYCVKKDIPSPAGTLVEHKIEAYGHTSYLRPPYLPKFWWQTASFFTYVNVSGLWIETKVRLLQYFEPNLLISSLLNLVIPTLSTYHTSLSVKSCWVFMTH